MYRLLITVCLLLSVWNSSTLGEEFAVERELWIASEVGTQSIVIDGQFSDWSPVEVFEASPRMGVYSLKLAWSEESLFVYVEVNTDEASRDDSGESVANDFFNVGLDFGNENRLQYDENDFHFVVSVPDEEMGSVFVSLVRTGAEAIDLSEYVTALGERSGNEYAFELAIDWNLLPGGKSKIEDIGILIERKTKGGPFALPVLWGDLVLGNADGRCAPSVAKKVKKDQSDSERVYRLATQDPDVKGPITKETKAEIAALKNRIIESVEIGSDEYDLGSLLQNLDAQGRWVDLSYEIAKGGGASDYITHLDRLISLSLAFRSGDLSKAMQAEVEEAISRGSDYWIRNDFTFTNWWYNEIGVPLRFGRVALLVEDLLGEDRVDQIIAIMERSYRPMTGQNLVWINTIQIIRGTLIKNPELIRRSFENLADTIVVTLGEGIQSDFSFHQHGPQLYSHSYGASFVEFAADVLYFSGSGEFALDEGKKELVVNLLLEGNRWMARGRFADFGALSRVVSRPGVDASYLATVSEKLLRLETGREKELKQLALSTLGEAKDPLKGNRYFHRSEFLVQRNEDFYASVKMYSDQMTGTESINGEGLKSYYLSDGATFFVRRGNEYLGIPPVWDWRRIPGVTNEDSDEAVPDLDYRKVETRGGSPYVGGVSDGPVGAATYDYRRDGIHALKSYFGFDFGLVCLGTGISSGEEVQVQTTINQTLRSGPVWARVGGVLDPKTGKRVEDRFSSEQGATISHDGFVYWVPGDQKVVVETRVQSGSWSEINDRKSDLPIYAEVVTLRLDHGVEPQNGNYAYAVMPEEKLVGRSEPPFEILANTKKLQAVKAVDESVVQAVFHEPTSFEFEEGIRVEADSQCLLLLVAEKNGYRATIANSERKGAKVKITLRRDELSRSEQFLLPSGRSEAGSSVSAFIDFK